MLKYNFSQKLFKCKKSYYKKVGYNPRCNFKEIFDKNNSKYCII